MKCYKAKWIITATGEVLEDMALVVDEGKIKEIIPNDKTGKFIPDKELKDLGNAVVTPGFVDLLTQYQFTDIGKFRPTTTKNKIKRFFRTLSKNYNFAGVKANNYSRKWADILCDYFVFDRSEKIQSFKDGMFESIKAGTTCIAQVSKENKYFDILNKTPIKSYLFFEVFADSSEKSKKTFKELKEKIENYVFHKGENTHIGLMLHSPSGVHKKLWALFSKYCRKHNMLLMTRLAEAKDENEWMEHGFSDIDILHKFMGLRKNTPYQTGIDAVTYLDDLKVLTNKVIVANCNFLGAEEIKHLAQTGVGFVYQPRYSREICNRSIEYETVLANFEKNFGFSTQSFKKDKDFSLLRLAVEENKDKLDITELIKYITIYPAKILRLEHQIGTIEVGKDADFNVFKLKDGEDYRALVNKHYPYSTYCKGRKIVKRGDIRFSV